MNIENNDSSSGQVFRVRVIKIFFGNLSFFATQEQLRELLSPFGPVHAVHICKTKDMEPLYYGFVHIKDVTQAECVMAQLNGRKFLGRKLRLRCHDLSSIRRQLQPPSFRSTLPEIVSDGTPSDGHYKEGVQVLFSFMSAQSTSLLFTEAVFDSIFQTCGEVEDCVIKSHLTDTRPRHENMEGNENLEKMKERHEGPVEYLRQGGYGFVTFADWPAAQRAVAEVEIAVIQISHSKTSTSENDNPLNLEIEFIKRNSFEVQFRATSVGSADVCFVDLDCKFSKSASSQAEILDIDLPRTCLVSRPSPSFSPFRKTTKFGTSPGTTPVAAATYNARDVSGPPSSEFGPIPPDNGMEFLPYNADNLSNPSSSSYLMTETYSHQLQVQDYTNPNQQGHGQHGPVALNNQFQTPTPNANQSSLAALPISPPQFHRNISFPPNMIHSRGPTAPFPMRLNTMPFVQEPMVVMIPNSAIVQPQRVIHIPSHLIPLAAVDPTILPPRPFPPSLSQSQPYIPPPIVPTPVPVMPYLPTASAAAYSPMIMNTSSSIPLVSMPPRYVVMVNHPPSNFPPSMGYNSSQRDQQYPPSYY